MYPELPGSYKQVLLISSVIGGRKFTPVDEGGSGR